MSNTKTKRKKLNPETASQRFYKEIRKIKPLLPKDWNEQFLDAYPEYNTRKGTILVHNVINCKSTDYIILDALKEIVAKNN
jgi:hypothetical protein